MSTTARARVGPCKLSRGSVWRRWDLHIHSPLSALNNQFPQLPNGQGPNWEVYIQALESLQDVRVVGITDYFSIAGFKALTKFRSEGRLANLDCILPNIELRLDTFVVQDKSKDINFHVIFSDEVTAEVIEEQFLRALRIQAGGITDDVRQLTDRALLELGQEIKKHHPTFRNDSDMAAAIKNITVSLQDVQALLRKGCFENKFLLVLGGSEWGDIDWNQAYLTKKSLFQAAHILDTSSPSTISWALGKKGAGFEQEFGRRKPCIHGSDAHTLEGLGNPSARRYCWIKADPTFEGLRQVLFEPEERVFIGETPANLKHDHQVMSSISISGASDWFDDVPIPLNRDLVAVVGGRGSGKSALAEVIAMAGRAELFSPRQKDKSKDLKDYFLYKASRKSQTNSNPITGAVVTLTWADGTSDFVNIDQRLTHDGGDERVKYLPQKFVEFLCAPENTDHIEDEIERVIFQRLDKTQRLGVSNFRELREKSTESIRLRKQRLAEMISSLNRSIADLESRIAQRDSKARQLLAKQEESKRLDQSRPELQNGTQVEIEKLEALEAERRAIEQKIVGYSQTLTVTDSIATKIQLFSEDIAAFNRELSNLLQLAGLESRVETFLVQAPEGYKDAIETRRAEIAALVATLRGAADSPPDVRSLRAIDSEIKAIKDRSRLAQEAREAFDKYQVERAELSEAIESLNREITEIDRELIPLRRSQDDERIRKYVDFFELLEVEQQTLERLYEPLRTALLTGTETDKKLAFIARFAFDTSTFAQRGLELIDRTRKGPYREDGSLETALKQYWAALENENFQRDSLLHAIQRFRESFEDEENDAKVRISDQLRRGKTLHDFDEWFFGTDCLSVVYSMRFEGKDLQLLSPGQKGIVLLLVYLEVDQSDNRPLIIDQPEDNLDNLSVYTNLIDYFRKRKKTRQILIITHNPNLVVNTDAEQMIVANYDGAATPRITYVSGAIENTGKSPNPGVRELVCDVLEGGTEAFQKREQKYSLPPM